MQFQRFLSAVTLLMVLGCKASEEVPGAAAPEEVNAQLASESARTCKSVGPGTDGELSLTPRPKRGIEFVALGLGDGFVADDATYGRIEDDLAAFDKLRPDLAPLSTYFAAPVQALAVTVRDQAMLSELQNGTYEPWRCLNDRYALASERYDWFDALGFGMATIVFAGVYRMDAVFTAYAEQTGLELDRHPFITLPGPAGGVKMQREDDAWTYTFQTLGEICGDSGQCRVVGRATFTSGSAGPSLLEFESGGCLCWPS